MKFYIISLLFIVSIFCCFLSACHSKVSTDRPKTYPCTIKVTKGGNTVEGAMVLLTRTSQHNNWAVSGITNSEGIAVIHTSYTNFTEPGSPEGMFKVTINKTLPPYIDSTPENVLNAMSYEERLNHETKIMMEARKRPPIIPSKYSNLAQTPLIIEVKSDSSSEVVFDVEQ
jgi:hypothetical protein